MKKLKYIFPVLALFFLACDSDDDGFYNSVYIQSSGLMTIENPAPTYNVGDVIDISAHIPRLLDEPGQTQPLDVMATTHADTFQFTFFVEKENTDGTWELVDVTGDFVEGAEGFANVGYFVQAFLQFDDVADNYLFDGGLVLDQPGSYRLNFSNNTVNADKVFFRSDSENNNIVLNIFSASSQLQDNGTFEFTVN